MTELDLGKYRTIRFWENDPPDISYESTTILSAELPAIGADADKLLVTTFCVEYKANLGGRISYGALGSTFEPSKGSTLRIEVIVKENGWRVYNEAAYGGSDQIYVGLPDIFAESVLETSVAFSGTQIPSGRLTFSFAAFSDVGSSQDVFEKLSYVNSRYHYSLSETTDKVPVKDLFSIFT